MILKMIGMIQHQLLLLGQRQRVLARFIKRVAVQDDLGTQGAGAFDLHARREARHHDDRAQPQTLGMVGHALGVVARTHGHHATRALGRVQLSQLVASPALLEGGGVLQVFKFQKQLAASDLR